MNHLYNNNDDKLRSKLTEHEFNIMPGAWDDMANRLDHYDFQPKAGGWWWSFPIIGVSLLVGSLAIGNYWKKDTLVQAEKPFLTPVVAQQQATPKMTHPIAAISVKNLDAFKVAENQNTVSPFEEKAEQPVKKKTVKKSTVAKVQNPTVLAANPIISPEETKENKKTAEANVKRTKTIIKRQYSITPLKKLAERPSMVRTKKTPIVGSFGIGDQEANNVSRWKFSVNAGVNTKVYGQTQKLSVSPYGGVSVGYRAGAHHGIQLGLQYKNIGKINKENPTTAVNSQLAAVPVVGYGIRRIDMLEVPLVYQCYPHPRMNVFAGVKGAWLFNVETASPEINALTNKEKGIENFDVSLLVGAEFNVTRHIAIGLQYSLGFVNLTAPAETTVLEYNSQYLGTTPAEMDQSVLRDAGEMLVPTSVKSQDNGYQPMLKLPKKLHNTDLQLQLKYTF
ncbi:MAG: PorT family protein [Aureispira sp.]|nr:PorT family protein [Aureispira sp.]